MNGRILTFGELLLRFSPDVEARWLSRNECPVFVGGAEANVATALALWQRPVSYITAMPDNLLSGQLLAYLNEKNIDTSRVHFAGERLGIFYLPVGSDMKNGATIYDRKYSSFYQLQPGDIDWDKTLEGVSWLHFSALTPALNAILADVCEEALLAAKAKQIIVSVDLNFRPQLWQYGQSPSEIMPRLVQYCDVVMGNIWAAEKMLSIPFAKELVEGLATDKDYAAQAIDSSKKIMHAFPQVKYVANTFRFDAESRNGIQYYATLFTNERLHISRQYNTGKIVDKVGSGDCFMAGLIDGIYGEKQPQDILEYATAAAFSKLFIKGDTTTSTRDTISGML